VAGKRQRQPSSRVFKNQGYSPLLVARDIQRPAAIDQLEILAEENELQFSAKGIPRICRKSPNTP
jgi:signal recognition particle GTPase